MSKSFKCFKGSRTSSAAGWRGSWVHYEVRVFRRSLRVDGFQNIIIQGFRASRVIGFQDMWGYISNVSPGHRVPLASWAFGTSLAFPKIQGFQGTNDTPGRYPTPLGALIEHNFEPM